MSDSNVLDMTERRRLQRAIEHYGGMVQDPRFKRLAALAEETRQSVLRDPLPHLQRMGTLVSKLRQAIEEADHCLEGHGETSQPPKPHHVLMQERIARAREVLGTALEEK